MAIFKFNNGKEKPSALKIWTTLIDTPIHPREGYTEDQIKYRMFVYLQLTAENFKEAIKYCNDIIDNPKAVLTSILLSSTILASCSESDFSDLEVVSDVFPHWVSSELYTPYYLTKMLCIKLKDPQLLMDLFDKDRLHTDEHMHWTIDVGMSLRLTAYKLCNSLHMDEMLPYVTISYNSDPITIISIYEISTHICDQLMKSISVSDNYIIPEKAKTTISYFKLKDSNASQ